MATGTLSQPSPFSAVPSFQRKNPWAAGGCSTGGLTKAMSMVVLDDNTRDTNDVPMATQDQQVGTQPLLSQQPSTQLQACGSRDLGGIARRLALDLSQQNSQELGQFSTPDFATPVEHRFDLDYAAAICEDGASRSPAPSPQRFQKRPRPMAEVDGDSMSQQSLSQSRSQSEVSTCSKVLSGLMPGKPPVHPNRLSRLKRVEPPVIRNPYLTPGNDDHHIYHPPTSKAEPTPPRQNRLMWDYKQEERLGQGNFSTVYRIVHRMSGKSYALKKSRKPVQSVADKNMWLAEIQALAAVEGHPNVVTYYDSWVELAEGGENICIKLELCGESLAAAWHSSAGASAAASGGAGPSAGSSSGGQRTPMKESELLEVLRQMASALKHIHALGLAHLDLKPDNIYRARPQGPAAAAALAARLGVSMPASCSQQGLGSGSQQPASQAPSPPLQVFKLGDFGLATPKNAAAGMTEGDARYLAPELLNSRGSDAGLDKADMFALGATLYELATGSPLPTGGERYAAIRHGQLMMMPCVSVKLQGLIKKLMSADPKERPSADAVLRSPLLARSNSISQINFTASSPRADS